MVRSLAVTTLYVTHDPTEALAMADRVALLHEGRVRQLDPPGTLYDRPVDLVTAATVAPIGLVPARVVHAGELAGYRVGAVTLPLWGPAPSEVDDRELVLGIRAEDVLTVAAADAVPVDAVVTGVEYTGRHQAVARSRIERPATGHRARRRAVRGRRGDAARALPGRSSRSAPGTRYGSGSTPGARTSSTPAPVARCTTREPAPPVSPHAAGRSRAPW